MMPQPFTTNSNYRSVIRSLLRIHQLWVEGKGESPEADAIRDDDRSWRLLSEVERKRIRGLSQDLNSISEPPAVHGSIEMNPQAQAKLVEANEARQRGEWDRALELLRRWGKHVAPALLSYLRGSIWFFDAGDAETAVVFYEHAAHLEPTNANYRALLLDVLQKANPERAITLAEEVIRDSDANDPGVVVHAAHVLFGNTTQMSAAEAIPTYRRLIPILK